MDRFFEPYHQADARGFTLICLEKGCHVGRARLDHRLSTAAHEPAVSLVARLVERKSGCSGQRCCDLTVSVYLRGIRHRISGEVTGTLSEVRRNPCRGRRPRVE